MEKQITFYGTNSTVKFYSTNSTVKILRAMVSLELHQNATKYSKVAIRFYWVSHKHTPILSTLLIQRIEERIKRNKQSDWQKTTETFRQSSIDRSISNHHPLINSVIYPIAIIASHCIGINYSIALASPLLLLRLPSIVAITSSLLVGNDITHTIF